MNLFVHLILRLGGVVLLCLFCAVGWVLIDAHRAIEKEATASADRVAGALEALYWRELLWRGSLNRDHLIPIPEWETMATMKVISPGVCITFTPGKEPPRRLCSQLETISDPAPAWFKSFYDHVFGGYARVERPLTARQPLAGLIAAEPDGAAAVRQAWHRIDIVLSVAALLAAGIGIARRLVHRAIAAARPGHRRRAAAAGPRRLQLPPARLSHGGIQPDLPRGERSDHPPGGDDGTARRAHQSPVPGSGGGAPSPGARPPR